MKRVIVGTSPMLASAALLYINNCIDDQSYEVYVNYDVEFTSGELSLEDLAEIAYEHIVGPNLECYFDDLEEGNFTFEQFQRAVESYKSYIIEEAKREIHNYFDDAGLLV